MRKPLTTYAQVLTLNNDEVLEGYHDGADGEPEPGDNRTLSYWHGWRNGAVDGGRRKADEAQAMLAEDAVRRDPRSIFFVGGG